MKHFIVLFIFAATFIVRGRLEAASFATENCKQKFRNQPKGVLEFSNQESSAIYDKDQTICTWTIQMEEGHKIAVIIQDLQININDSLVITEFQNGHLSAPLNNRSFFTLQPGSVLFSQSNTIKIELIVYHNSIVNFKALFEEAQCGGSIIEKQGEIEVPLFVHLSESPHDCKWRLSGPTGKIIKISTLQFSLPAGSCLFESLTLRDESLGAENLIGDFCEENPPMGDILSKTNAMTIEFTKQPSFIMQNLITEPSKVRLRYEFIDSCNSKIQGLFGSISVPLHYPSHSPSESCMWDIKVPDDHYISLTFIKYTAAPRITGESQEINIYDGTDVNDTGLIWNSSESTFPPTRLLSETNNLKIVRSTKQNSLESRSLSFEAVYQAHIDTNTWPDECVSVGDRRFFKCSNGHYIDCDWRCDGVANCDDAIDEFSCPAEAANYEIVDEDTDASFVGLGGMILVLALIGSALTACMFVLSLDRAMHNGILGVFKEPTDRYDKTTRSSLTSPLPPLPPYTENDTTELDNPPAYQQEEVRCIQGSSRKDADSKHKDINGIVNPCI